MEIIKATKDLCGGGPYKKTRATEVARVVLEAHRRFSKVSDKPGQLNKLYGNWGLHLTERLLDAFSDYPPGDKCEHVIACRIRAINELLASLGFSPIKWNYTDKEVSHDRRSGRAQSARA